MVLEYIELYHDGLGHCLALPVKVAQLLDGSTLAFFPLPEVVGLWVQGLAIFVVDSLCCPRGNRVPNP